MPRRLFLLFLILSLSSSAAEAQAVVKALTYAGTKALPAGRGYAIAAITGVASMATAGVVGGAAYDALNNLTGGGFKNAFNPQAPDQRPPLSPPAGDKPQPESSLPSSLADAGRLASAFPSVNPSTGCLLAGCKPIDFSKLLEFNPPAPPPTSLSAIIAPPPVPNCEGSSLDGLEALQRGANLDSGSSFAPRNAPAARTCYYVAAQQNIPVAQFNLADMLLAGDVGVPRDQDRGFEYLEAAARNGFLPAQIRLGDAYDKGGTRPNPSAAFNWYAVAANAGSTYAQYQLSRFFYDAKDYVGAFVWLNTALIGGYQPAFATMQELLAIVYADARTGIAGAQFIVGAASEFGVPGLIKPDPRSAFLAYRDALRGNWSVAPSALQRVCFNFPAACF